MSDTPETDAFRDSQFADRVDEMDKLYDLAEKLERERDKMMKLFESSKRARASLNEALDKTLHERREAMERNAKLRDIAERILLNCETLHPNTVKLHRKELDQLKEGGK